VLGVLLMALIGSVGIDLSKLTTGMGDIGVLMSGKLYPVVTAPGLISRAVIVVVIAAIASLYPAWQASRQEPAKALHHV
jgi:ABC-type lipoprotein release transport system permease subunit